MERVKTRSVWVNGGRRSSYLFRGTNGGERVWSNKEQFVCVCVCVCAVDCARKKIRIPVTPRRESWLKPVGIASGVRPALGQVAHQRLPPLNTAFTAIIDSGRRWRGELTGLVMWCACSSSPAAEPEMTDEIFRTLQIIVVLYIMRRNSQCNLFYRLLKKTRTVQINHYNCFFLNYN